MLAYGAASSSVATAKAFMNYAVPEVGHRRRTSTLSVDFGTSRCRSARARTEERRRRRRVPSDGRGDQCGRRSGPAAERCRHEGDASWRGYGQDFLDSPAAKSLPDNHLHAGYKPVELKARPPRSSKPTSRSTSTSPVFRTSASTPATSSPTTPSNPCREPETRRRGRASSRRSRHGHLRPSGPRVHAGRREPPGPGQDPVDELRVLRAAQGREVRAVPEERQAGERQARRLPRSPGRDPEWCGRDDHHRGARLHDLTIPPSEDEVLGYFDTLSNWSRWGEDDQLGTLNLITPEARRRGAPRTPRRQRLVRVGSADRSRRSRSFDVRIPVRADMPGARRRHDARLPRRPAVGIVG